MRQKSELEVDNGPGEGSGRPLVYPLHTLQCHAGLPVLVGQVLASGPRGCFELDPGRLGPGDLGDGRPRPEVPPPRPGVHGDTLQDMTLYNLKQYVPVNLNIFVFKLKLVCRETSKYDIYMYIT